jgi:hypothetical protein
VKCGSNQEASAIFSPIHLRCCQPCRLHPPVNSALTRRSYIDFFLTFLSNRGVTEAMP